MLQIKRAGHSTLATPDLERMVDYFTDIVGLSVAAREKNRAILATKSGLEAIVLEGDGAAYPLFAVLDVPDHRAAAFAGVFSLGVRDHDVPRLGINFDHESILPPWRCTALASNRDRQEAGKQPGLAGTLPSVRSLTVAARYDYSFQNGSLRYLVAPSHNTVTITPVRPC